MYGYCPNCGADMREEGKEVSVYIDKQAVMNKFAEVVAPSNNSDFQKPPTWNDAVEIVENFPSADVRPVVRGRWVPVTIGRGGHECSKCHQYAPSYQSGSEYLSRFYPACGCYMGEC